jgi:hypothetical protein
VEKSIKKAPETLVAGLRGVVHVAVVRLIPQLLSARISPRPLNERLKELR